MKKKNNKVDGYCCFAVRPGTEKSEGKQQITIPGGRGPRARGPRESHAIRFTRYTRYTTTIVIIIVITVM